MLTIARLIAIGCLLPSTLTLAHEDAFTDSGQLAIDREIIGPENRNVAMTLNHLGSSYRATGYTDRALELHTESLAIRKKVLGDDHPDVSMSLTNIGAVYTDRNQWDEALDYYRQSHAILVKRLGKDDPDAASVVIGIAKVHVLSNAPAKALKLLESAGPGLAKATELDQSLAAFVEAQALWIGGGDKPRALELAQQARDGFVAEGKTAAPYLAEVDVWLAEHR